MGYAIPLTGGIHPFDNIVRTFLFIVLGLFASVLGPLHAQDRPFNQAFVFYYAWYDSDPLGRGYDHWDQNRRIPPEDIAASFYPKLGPYSSADQVVIDQHLSWIAEARIGVLVFGYQGPETPSAEALPLVMDSAERHGLKVAFLIDQNPKKSPTEMLAEIERLTIDYGAHPAFLKVEQQTVWSSPGRARGVFFLYDPFLGGSVATGEWTHLVNEIRNSVYDVLLLGHGFEMRAAYQAHFDGLFTFDVLKTDPSLFPTLKAQADRMGILFVPTVGPGYDDQRAVDVSAGALGRERGLVYDRLWREVAKIDPTWVSINSFNEWHEGTQIEPAVGFETPFARYLNYEGSYGREGAAAENAYIDQTANWLDRLFGLPTRPDPLQPTR